jgi:hypothetical protein
MRIRHTLQHIVLGGTVILIGIVVVLTMRHIPVPILSDLPVFQKVLIPNKKNLSVPFTSQAPAGNWAEPWQNACEETAIVMVNNYYMKSVLNKENAIGEISTILTVKEQHFGVSKNETMETMLGMIQSAKLSWRARIVVDPSLDALKNELAEGRPIIIPVDARLLTNPYYDVVTPDYHVIVLSGYDNGTKQFITQDPGTDKGHDFLYSYDELMNANHDYLESNLRQGRKAMIFTGPPKIFKL